MTKKNEFVYVTEKGGLEADVEAVYLINESSLGAHIDYQFLSKKHFKRLLRNLPFHFSTAPLNHPNDSYSSENGLIGKLMIADPPGPGIIDIYPPKGRRMEFLRLGRTRGLYPDSVMDDADGGGFRCCYHPKLSYFGIKSKNKSDNTIEIDVFKFHPNDAYKIYEFLETMKIPNATLREIEHYKKLLGSKDLKK